MKAAVGAVLSERDGIFALKEARRMALKDFLDLKKMFFALQPIDFGKSLIKDCGASQLTTGW